MDKTLAFADKYGNNSFDFNSQGTHFIVSTILIKENEKNDILEKLELIRQRYFQNGELKSSKVGSNYKRRLLILKDLSTLKFKIFSIVVDKEKLVGEGFTYKKSFYKFVCGLAYRELYKTFPRLTISVDEHGSNEFMRSFKKYVELNHIRDLFEGSDFNFVSSNSNLLIQLADFIGGTIGRCYDKSKNDTHLTEYIKILENNLSTISFFPTEYNSLAYSPEEKDDRYDSQIAELAIKRALDFIEVKKIKNQEDTDQINLVRLLLLYQRAFSPRLYITTTELIRHLQTFHEKPITKQYFRAKLIGKLRDNGVLIASSSHGNAKGYKLPANLQDIYSFINHGNTQIIPMINRIKKCRDTLLLATHNKIDVLDKPQYSQLKSIIETQKNETYLEYKKGSSKL